MLRRIGLVTIGQSPRKDVTHDMTPIIGSNVTITECGALDGLSTSEIEEFAPKDNEDVLVTRLSDGREVRVSYKKIMRRLVDCIRSLEKHVDIIAILCTGDFPKISSSRLIIKPSDLMLAIVKVMAPTSLGVIVPDDSQRCFAKRRWSAVSQEIHVKVFSPYTGRLEDLAKLTQDLRTCDVIVMDCIGYTSKMKDIVKKVTERPVILPRTLLARVLSELI